MLWDNFKKLCRLVPTVVIKCWSLACPSTSIKADALVVHDVMLFYYAVALSLGVGLQCLRKQVLPHKRTYEVWLEFSEL